MDVEAIINSVTGHNQRSYRLKKFEYQQEYITKMISLVGEEYFTEELKMEKEQIMNFCSFIYYTCKEEIIEVINAGNKLELMRIMNDNLNKYPAN
jgi:hypothetical protein